MMNLQFHVIKNVSDLHLPVRKKVVVCNNVAVNIVVSWLAEDMIMLTGVSPNMMTSCMRHKTPGSPSNNGLVHLWNNSSALEIPIGSLLKYHTYIIIAGHFHRWKFS